MKTLLIALCAILALCCAAPAGAIRLPLGNGHTAKVKAHRRALKSSQFSVQTGAGFSAASWGPRYAR
jgi:hypothetical protein